MRNVLIIQKKSNPDYAEIGSKEFLLRGVKKIGCTYGSLFIYLCLGVIYC
jgi:hypothetical protein